MVFAMEEKEIKKKSDKKRENDENLKYLQFAQQKEQMKNDILQKKAEENALKFYKIIFLH